MKETFYFSHDYNARNDSKIKKLIFKLGYQGYGLYWAIVEELYQNANALQTDYESIAFDLRTTCEIVKSLVEDFDLFAINDGYFSSNSVERRMSERAERSTKARDSAMARWGKNANALRTHCESNAIKERKGKERKVNKSKEKEEENGAASLDEKNDSSLPKDKKKRTPRSSAATPLNFPFKGERFNGLWERLMTSRKWANKTVSALQMSLDKLAKYEEEFACLLISDAIEKDWQGVVYDDTPEKYRKWKTGNGGANSMANPELVRTGQVLHTTTENQQRIIDKMYERNGLKRDDKQAGTA